MAPPYHADPVYIEAIADVATTRNWASCLSSPDVILASFHGIPRDYCRQGRPLITDHCAKTTRLLRSALGLDENQFRLTFQSRFGPAEWLQPYTDKTVEALAKGGVKNLAIVTPGFSG